SIFNKCFNKKNNVDRKKHTRSYRLLGKHKQERSSPIIWIKEEIPINEVNEKEDISNSEKGSKRKIKQSDECLLHNMEEEQQYNKYKSIFETKGHFSYLEKKIFRELDYKDHRKHNRTISNKVYKKLTRKNYIIRSTLLLLFIFLVLMVPIADISLRYLVDKGGLLKALGLFHANAGTLGTFVSTGGSLMKGLGIGKWNYVDIVKLSPILTYCTLLWSIDCKIFNDIPIRHNYNSL
ncbi:Plasmodium exported protein (Pm-fam-a like), unknown function, partial [Plasmodium malariae]